MKAQGKQLAFEFDESLDLPMWVQLRNRISYLIGTGFFQPGEKLPTVRKVAADLRIAYNTVSKAYMGLERDGYVKTVRGSGVYVREKEGEGDRGARVGSLVEEFINSCLKEGVALEDVPKLVSKSVNEMGRDRDR